MKLAEYSPQAMLLCKRGDLHFDLEHAVLGIVTEAAELADAYKRLRVYDKPLDPVNLIEEVGDSLWYCNLMCVALREPLETWQVEQEQLLLRSLQARPFSPGEQISCVLNIQASAGHLAALVEKVVGLGIKRGAGGALVEALDKHIRNLAWFSHVHGFTLGQAAEKNIAKLRVRYPHGFATDKALGRDLAAERRALEDSDKDDGGKGGAPAAPGATISITSGTVFSTDRPEVLQFGALARVIPLGSASANPRPDPNAPPPAA
jgi:NTP pyrophosphatase (non-canonical NTP hydrolase)